MVQLVDEHRRAAQKVGHVVHDGLPLAVGITHGLHERAGGDGPGVHKRRGRVVVLQQDSEDGVEGKPRGIGADLLQQRLGALLAQRENGRMHLRCRADSWYRPRR